MFQSKTDFPYILLKVSKRKYLQDIKDGHLYFNSIEYFRELESEINVSAADTKEGKTKLNFLSTLDVLPDYMKFFEKSPPEDFNFSILSHKDIPIFCWSLVDKSILVKTDENRYDFKQSFIDEMKSWGNSVLVVSLEELIYKINKKCKELGIKMLADKVEYDQDEKEYTWDEYTKIISEDPYFPLFHKTAKYKNQHEFRIALISSKTDLRNDHFLDVGNLETAEIIDLNSLDDLGVKIV